MRSRSSSFALSLSAFLLEIVVEAVEDPGASRNPFRVILGRDADAFDQRSDPCDLGAAELVVLEIDIVDDLRDGAKRRVFQCAAIEQDFERALVALVRKLGLEHVEAKLAIFRSIPLAGYKFESSLRVDEAAYQPGAGDPIHIDTLPRDPGSFAQRAERTFPGIDGRFLFHLFAFA